MTCEYNKFLIQLMDEEEERDGLSDEDALLVRGASTHGRGIGAVDTASLEGVMVVDMGGHLTVNGGCKECKRVGKRATTKGMYKRVWKGKQEGKEEEGRI